MPNPQHIQKLVKTHERRLQVLEQQQAAMGVMTPPHIVTEIEDIKQEIESLQTELTKQEDAVEATYQTNSPISQETSAEPKLDAEKEIFISYAWGGESEEIVNQLDQAFQDKGITIIRDKRNLDYKGRIKEFMERIGRGKCIIVVISKKYLESENCMFELWKSPKTANFTTDFSQSC